MPKPLKVTVEDPETGETATTEIPPGSYLLLCAEPCHRTALNAYATGTHQITVKGVTNPMDGVFLGQRGPSGGENE
ncbi:hypothetical protein [Nonomuraea rubra]|uniref:Uncharacterized protein n=1 Tax=Nonomuraea rubra TaxID=46180 RepID=A0A7X0U5U4_9ACTN|nr:hypothetical protein [Nonomuraea rubra]MBB6556228.1 hypothetical protein [Nonomuraea rubra]